MFVQRWCSTSAVLLGQSARIAGLRAQNFHARDAVALHLLHHERPPAVHYRFARRRDVTQLMQQKSGQRFESGVARQLVTSQ